MSLPNWGSLQKSQSDPETIEEAITRLIDAHLADADAHLGAGESLQSHKASAIIDHEVESIVSDKIADRNVLIDHLEDMGGWYRLSLPFESLDGWDITVGANSSITNDIGVVTLTAYDGESALMSFGWQGFPCLDEMKTRILVNSYSYEDLTAYIGTGGLAYTGAQNQGIGYKIIDEVLYACWRTSNGSASTEHTAEIGAIAGFTWSNLEIVYVAGEKIEWWVNDVLEHSTTTDLPSLDYGFWYPWSIKLIGQATEDTRDLMIASPYLASKL